MKPTVVIVGRPNVGKSTLFNRLTRTREAIVVDAPGITRDRHYGEGRVGPKSYLVVDTGGFEPVAKDGIYHQMARQTRQAVDEADVVLFIVDARAGLTAQDREIGEDLMDRVLADFPAPDREKEDDSKHPKIAIVGRPNVGKSTLVNALLGEERVVVFDLPGTTRDSISIDFEREGKRYTLVDTAGMRKRGKVDEAVEKFSVIKTLQSIADANIAILVLDARQEISEQDAHIAGFILEAGRALVVAVNKWEGLSELEREQIKRDGARKLNFLNFARFHFISALEGQGIGALLRSADEAYAAAMSELATPRLTRALMMAVQQQQPPRSGMVRPKMRYAHQGGSNPPRIIVHGSALEGVPESYRRYLERFFRDTFKLTGTPLRVEFKTGRNPFADRAAKRR
jgi:GTP-binding protein